MFKTRQYVTVGVMLAALLAFQALHMPQIITGCFVNAILVFTSLYAGLSYGIVLSVLSPVGALITGILPSVMCPVLVIIALGNVFLINIFFLAKKTGVFARTILSSVVKAAFIGVSSYYVFLFFNLSETINIVLLPFSIVQFVTSAVGILLAEKIARVCNLEHLKSGMQVNKI